MQSAAKKLLINLKKIKLRLLFLKEYFRFKLPYEGLFGGVISILTEQFEEINGMSNVFEGWGGEDDDLFR